jgi:hypothetical protein
MARSRKTPAVGETSEEAIVEDAPVEEVVVEEPVAEAVVEPSAEALALQQAEEEEALREHIFFLTRGRVPVPVQPLAEWVGDPPPEPEAERACSYDEWIEELKYHSRPLLAGFRIIAARNGWYYAPPSFWEHQFTSWMHEPI